MESADYISLEERLGAHNYRPLDVVLQRGEGCWVYDVEGRRYLDCLSAYSALSHGHRHPKVLAALLEQAQRLTLTSRAFRNDQLGPFYEELHGRTGYPLALPMNSGSEAVETALKVARKWAYERKGVPPGQAEIIVARNNFHGRTITIVSFSTEPLYRDAFSPFTPGFVTVPYGDAAALSAALTPRTAAVLLEPIQGEGGVVVPPSGYLREAAAACAAAGVLLMADEIQTGLGRTGRLFCCDHEGVRPDVMILGKALGGGVLPVSVVLSDEPVLGLLRPGEHGSTFGGNPLAAAVARAALRALFEEGMIERAAETGTYLLDKLRRIGGPHLREARGKGLLLGLELRPEAGGARRFCEALLRRGVLCKETHRDVIRLAPPLLIERPAVDWLTEQLAEVLGAP